ncbi:MAG: HEPN domain-containing protein [Chloroflexi bacterium]|nr:HEPN domain-containing protein [Chloroflexota bacterium]
MAENAQDWLRYAQSDLRTAEILQHVDDFPTAIHAFHCQQAIEKSLKAYLVASAKHFLLRQNLTYLLGLCVSVDAAFRQFERPVAALVPFTTQSVYPADIEAAPTIEQSGEYYQYALSIVRFVAAQLGKPR